jgi:hypothetical protein
MRAIILLAFLWLGLNLCPLQAQVVKDPLLDYYQHIGKSSFYQENDASDFHYSPQSHVFCFDADFTGSNRKSVFITDLGQYLNFHDNYGWAIYVPVGSAGYRRVTDESTLIAAGPNGPPHVGYIDQLKGYGVVTGSKDEVTAYYLDKGTIQSKVIDQERGHADPRHYPKYFHGKPVDHHITIYTLAQLTQKYANPDSSNVISPASN